MLKIIIMDYNGNNDFLGSVNNDFEDDTELNFSTFDKEEDEDEEVGKKDNPLLDDEDEEDELE
ncbi:MAG: hypothetical protein US50_C0003G0007 [Candidatus Nomurabacteria bacterium GW2011_GWB1_37_5]|uniref:Uncharacterized protein n=1 Tax=Candidatus Nomurabacteria bacterium GW2011_GWB1_37_5 TaxID=1618742 RepID=A0A0G0H122_9BACT|nr:MAG: hypothetical protein US50_C0003G0007 [Candidatus Nomurabacteria bacterium GW2011_GWB1_37_5]